MRDAAVVGLAATTIALAMGETITQRGDEEE